MRVAFALSEIFVISNSSSIAFSYPRGPAQYLDNLERMHSATLPQPDRNGDVLADDGHLSIPSAQPEGKRDHRLGAGRKLRARGDAAFHHWSYELNPDGTQRRIAGRCDRNIHQQRRLRVGQVFTGSPGRTGHDGQPVPCRTADPNREIIPMIAYNQYHSITQKQFLGVTIPASTTTSVNTNNEVRIALDTLFNHQCSAVFSKTDSRNWSPPTRRPHTGRVVAVFANNGAGARRHEGDHQGRIDRPGSLAG